jgi:transposase
VAAIVVAVTGGGTEQSTPSAGAFAPVYDGLEERRVEAGVPTMAGGGGEHFHPLLEVYARGEQIPVPTNIGIDPAQPATMMAGLHTHDTTGTIHNEAGRGSTLGQFFAIWGVPFSPAELGPYSAGAKESVRMWVDGSLLHKPPSGRARSIRSMSQNFLPCDRDQQMLLPADLREWLADDHLAWFVLDAVEEMNLEQFFAGYRADGWGRAAHDPEMMVALLLYAYAVGERSSRKIEKRCAEDIAFRVIAANQAPDHTTIARFRARHADQLAELFSEVLTLCARADLVSVGTLALDGTRIAADAADRANRTYEQLAREILEEAAEVDAAEDERFGERRGDELPGDRQSRRERLREAKRRLDQEHEQKQRELAEWKVAKAEYTARTGLKKKGAPTKPRPIPPKERQRINVVDPDSRPVKTRHGFIQGYTAQAAATADQVIVAAELITGGNERHRLEPMAKAAEEELAKAGVDERPGVCLADAGYWNSPQIEALEQRGIKVLCPPDADSRKKPTKIRSGPDYERMRRRLREPEAEEAYRRRQQMIEPVFAQIKSRQRAGRFSRRGLAACRAEWRLTAATHNLLKLYRAGLRPQAA